MALNRDDQEKIRGFLLGRICDDEQQKIEERLMTDDDFFDELEISKDEIIEDYLAGELTPTENQWLEQHFLASPEGQLRRRFAVALDRIKPPAPEPVMAPVLPRSLTLIERIQFLWRTQPLTLAAAACAVVVLIGATIWLLISLPGKPPVAVTLISTTATRGESPPTPTVNVPAGAGEMKVSLVLPSSAPRGANYRVELVDENQALPIVGHDANSISVVIPTAQLRSDAYAIRIYAIKPDLTEERIPGSYFFNVQ